MSENQNQGGGMMQNIMIGILGVLTLVGLFLISQVNSRLNTLEAKVSTGESKLEKKISATEDVATNAKEKNEKLAEALSKQSVQTQRDIAARAAQLKKEQEAAVSTLTAQQQQQQAALEGVKTDVGGVKSDVGGVKTDVSGVRTDLEATKAKLSTAIGELNGQSGLIANTRDELEVLKHRGDRTYYEFTLPKNSKTPQAVSTVALQLKKTDPKKSKFTLVITADDKQIEKKDKGAGELMQFYTGRDHLMYELVVFNVDKDKVSGYISTPKNAPVPISR